MNRIYLTGRLTEDPTVRTTQAGDTVATFNVAVDRDYKNKDGKVPADFFRCTAFGKQGEFIEKYFEKGKPILIEGSMRNNNYEDKNGVKHYGVDITVARVEFFGGEKAKKEEPKKEEPQKDSNGFMQASGLEEDLPFM